ncbi:MAG: CPBP family intramembrane metalloprotease [Wenzhouxiangellaceae bacterium]|nr:CPBP family intramembrane metalloprotease [Wenzhouxiangellaceae bacterium]
MLRILPFFFVIGFSIAVGLLCSLGVSRFAEAAYLQRPLAQVFILAIFFLLAGKAGWLEAARITWNSTETNLHVTHLVWRLLALCAAGILLGIVVRLGVQGNVLVLLKLVSPRIYSDESRDLVELWQNQSEFSFDKIALFALGATREEIMYRYILIGAIIPLFGPLRALILSASVFAFIHLNPITFIFGIIFGALFMLTRSLLLVSAMHTTINAWHMIVAKFNLVPQDATQSDILNSGYGFALILAAGVLVLLGVLVVLEARNDGSFRETRSTAYR